MNATIVALGKIGLPLAVQVARSGVRTFGVDVNESVVDLISRSIPPFPGEALLDEYLTGVISSGALTVGTDTSAAVARADVVVVVVPLIVDSEGIPAFGALDAATREIGRALKPGTLVVYETTLPVGTTRGRFEPMLAEVSGLKIGDFLVAHSPERVYSGRIFSDFTRYPKLVGGTSAAAAERCIEFYEKVIQFDERPDLDRPNGVWDLGSAEAAELAKLAETTYRDVNIALANEFARFAETAGIDIGLVIDASNSQPFSHIHRPGIAVGGHCIPVYPRFYTSVDKEATLPVAARQVNLSVPERVVSRLASTLGGISGKTIVVLGATYRGGIKETAFSGVFDTVAALQGAGAIAVVDDPLFDNEELIAMGLAPYPPGSPVAGAILQADHPEYLTLTSANFPGIKAIYDGRSMLDPDLWSDIKYLRIGVG
jgi:nucleotide sugar dehydrogenase